DQHPQTPDALRTTHEAAVVTESHESRLVLGSPLPSPATTSSTSAAAASTASTPTATATAAATSTAATEPPTSASTPTPTPSSASTATTASPATSTSALAPLAPAVAAPLARRRRSADRLGANKVDSSSRGNGGQEGNGGAPLKERGTGVTTRGSYSGNTSLCCKETVLEEVNGRQGDGRRPSGAPTDNPTAKGKAISLGRAPITLVISIGGVTVPLKANRGRAAKSEHIVLCAFEIAEDPLGGRPVVAREATRCNVARQDTDWIGQIWSSAHHRVHEGTDELGVGLITRL
ncbi:unnamed protein product, partial [Closterium sp. NIES-54]